MSHPTYPSKENFIKGFSKDVSRAYRALSMMVRSQGMGMRGLQPLTYNQAYDRVLRIEAWNDKVGDVVGFGLSVASTVNPAGLGIKMGIAAIGIDLIQVDEYGVGTGVGAMVSRYGVPLDLAYGACRISTSCSNRLDKILP